MPVCTHCGFEVGPEAEACPLCGTGLSGGPAAGPGPAPVAWEDAAVAFPRDLLLTWRESLFEPAAFFARVGWAGGLARPVLYYLVVSVVGAFFTLWWEAVGWAPSLGIAGLEERIEGGAGALVNFFLSPFIALAALGIAGLVLHLFALLLAEDRRPLGDTYRVLCYGSGPGVFTAIPFAGPLVAAVWTVVLYVFGIREAHRTTTGRAAAIVLLPTLLLAAAVGALMLATLFLAGAAILGGIP